MELNESAGSENSRDTIPDLLKLSNSNLMANGKVMSGRVSYRGRGAPVFPPQKLYMIMMLCDGSDL